MSNIIKRRKTSNYTQINNYPMQNDLGNLSAIGLLAYIMSLPEDWILHKTHLQKTFTRRTVDSAWKILVEKKYAIGFYCHVNGKKNYFYMVSDIAFTETDFELFVKDNIELLLDSEDTVFNVVPIMDSPYEIPVEISIVHNVQHTTNSSKCSTTKELKTKETITNKHSLSIDNYQEPQTESVSNYETPEKSIEDHLTSICNEFYTTFSIGRWDKKTWSKLMDRFVIETIESERYKDIPSHKIRGYVYKAIENMAKHHDYKRSEDYVEYKDTIEELYSKPEMTEFEPTEYFYNWLEERD